MTVYMAVIPSNTKEAKEQKLGKEIQMSIEMGLSNMLHEVIHDKLFTQSNIAVL